MGTIWGNFWELATTSPLSRFHLIIEYLARRNFDPATGIDDQIIASYSTGYDYELKLGLSEFSPYEAIATNSAILRPFKAGAQVVVSAHMTVGNAGR